MSVTLHTDKGDLKIEVFCESVPRTAENFLALCASHYYDGSPIHRNIKSFMVQMGAPKSAKPKGGESIWGGKFEDELRPALKHNARGVVSMANNGPHSNGSQFFITYGKFDHLDGQNTVFGKVIDGYSTLEVIEELPVNEKMRPIEDLSIVGVT